MTSALSNLGQRQVLPTNVVPIHYNLVLTPDIKNAQIEGSVDIKVAFNEITDKIVFNSNELEIYNASLKTRDKNIIYFSLSSIVYDNKLTQTTIVLPTKVNSGTKGELTLKFRGILNDEKNGFYRSSYMDINNNEKYIAATQFEPTDARKAFPCWDEPAHKATFDLTLRVPKELAALSNMNIVEEKDLGLSLKQVKYATTPKMSTYLLAFVVGELEFIEKFTANKVKCRVYAPKGLAKQGTFALEIVIKSLELYNKLFKIPYPLPKMDLVAIPGSLAGAMENWGLVTFRENYLLLDESSSTKTKLDIANTVAHELAHQWFGNLVTMEWWSDLWLNEGFATWVSSYAIDKFYPEWDYWTLFGAINLQSALSLDSLRSSHPIEVEVNNPAEISQIFDSISYSKSGLVVHMLYSYLGEDIFFAGICDYLQQHRYENAKTSDLWSSLSKVSNQNISKFMNIWIKQVGYPYLEVSEFIEGYKLMANVEQKRFLVSGKTKPEEDCNLWWVPINLIYNDSNSASQSLILTEKSKNITLSNIMYKFNNNSLVPYRVHYSKSVIKRLVPHFKTNNALTVLDRLSLVSNMAAFSQSGLNSAADFFDLLEYFSEENNYYVLDQISSHLSSIQSIWFEEFLYVKEGLRKLMRSIFSPIVKTLGWEIKKDESVSDNLLRTLGITKAGLNGDLLVIKEAQRRFDAYVKGDKKIINPDLLEPVFQIVAQSADQETYNLLMKQCLEASSPELKRFYLKSLGFVHDPVLVATTLEFSISDKVGLQDSIYMFSALGENPLARRKFWEFVQLRWSSLEKSHEYVLDVLISSSASGLSSSNDFSQVSTFFQGKDTSKFILSLKQTLEKIQINSAVLQRDQDTVANWLHTHFSQNQ